ncbi:MAG: hypothetical protein P1U86_15000 [Verrucomicrobiales bacterium]|nr:hypothetical protein [Verrucomicrobiales bacterium]
MTRTFCEENCVTHMLFGTTTQEVWDLIKELEAYPWFSRIEQPHPNDSDLVRGDLEWILDGQERPWGGAMGIEQGKIDSVILGNQRLSDQSALDREYKCPIDPSDLLEDLLERYDDYYKETYSYAHELLDLPHAAIRYAVYEKLVSDIAPDLTFFTKLLPYFRDGYWPCGWQGEYPDGKLIVL